MICNDRASLSRLPARANPCLMHIGTPIVRTSACVGVRRLHLPVATQGLSTLTTPCRDTGSKGLYRDRENLYHDPSHPVPALNPITTPKFYRDTKPSNLCCDRGAMGSLSRQGFSVATGLPPCHAHAHTVMSGISIALVSCALLRALSACQVHCRAHCCTTLSRQGEPGFYT